MTTLTPERIEELATALRRFATTEHGKRFRLHADIMRLVFSDPLSLADALSRDGMREAPEGWRLVPDHVTAEWITALDAALVKSFGSTPGGQQIADGLRIFLDAAPKWVGRDAALSPDAPRQKVEG